MTNTFHIGLHVSDIQATISFYKMFLGADPIKVKTDYAKFELEDPGLILTFNVHKNGVSPSFGHLGIRVNNSQKLESWKETVTKKGLEVEEEINTRCCYALQDKFWVKDPDGYSWEVFHKRQDVEENDSVNDSVCCQN